VTILDSVTGIEKRAFYGCQSLDSVTIPAVVTYIGDEAFGRCDNLTLYAAKGSFAEMNEVYSFHKTGLCLYVDNPQNPKTH